MLVSPLMAIQRKSALLVIHLARLASITTWLGISVNVLSAQAPTLIVVPERIFALKSALRDTSFPHQMFAASAKSHARVVSVTKAHAHLALQTQMFQTCSTTSVLMFVQSNTFL